MSIQPLHRRLSLWLFIAWSGVIALATWITWNPAVRLASTLWQSASVGLLALAKLPAALLAQAPAALWVGALLYSQWALGGWLARFAARRLRTPDLGPVACLVLGQGLQGLVVFCLGMSDLLYPPFLLTAVLALVAARLLIHRDLLVVLALFFRLRRWRPARPELTGERLLRWAFVAGLGVTLALALATTLQPVWFYDVLAYHFGTPNQWLLDHGFVRNLDDVLSFFPGQSEALFALALAGGGTTAAQLLNVAFLPLLLAWTGEARLVPGASWRLAGLFLLSTPVLILTGSLSKPDIALVLYAAITFDLTLHAAALREVRAFGVAGLFGGLCLASKYTAILLVGWPALAVAGLSLVVARQWTTAARGLGLWLLAGLLFAAPWLVRNGLWTGNPVYPAAFALLGGEGWSAAQAVLIDSDAHRRGLSDFGAGSLWQLLWGVTFSPWGELINRFGAFGVLGPGLLWLAPVAAWRDRGKRAARWGWALVLLILLTAVATSWIVRFWAVALPIAALLISRSLADWRKMGRLPRGVAAAVCLVVFAANGTYVWRELLGHTAGMAVVAGDHDADSFRGAMSVRRPIELGTFGLLRQLDQLPPGKVMLVGDTVHAYVDRPHHHSSGLNRPAIAPYLVVADPAAIAAQLRAAGFRYLLINPRELARVGRRLELLALTGEERAALAHLSNSDEVTCLAGGCGDDARPTLLDLDVASRSTSGHEQSP